MVPLVDLSGVSVQGCRKPNCRYPATLNRHHYKHEAMWRGIWASRRRGEERWLQFLQRYEEFREEDVVIICTHHHAEIHQIYDRLIKADVVKTQRALSQYTWTQAEHLMDKLKSCCLAWLKEPSQGINPDAFRRRRGKRQARRRS